MSVNVVTGSTRIFAAAFPDLDGKSVVILVFENDGTRCPTVSIPTARVPEVIEELAKALKFNVELGHFGEIGEEKTSE